jgi:hypothetical protein
MTHVSKQALSESHVSELALFLSYIMRGDLIDKFHGNNLETSVVNYTKIQI